MRADKEKNICFESNHTIDYRGQHLTKQGATFETLTGQEGTKNDTGKKYIILCLQIRKMTSMKRHTSDGDVKSDTRAIPTTMMTETTTNTKRTTRATGAKH